MRQSPLRIGLLVSGSPLKCVELAETHPAPAYRDEQPGCGRGARVPKQEKQSWEDSSSTLFQGILRHCEFALPENAFTRDVLAGPDVADGIGGELPPDSAPAVADIETALIEIPILEAMLTPVLRQVAFVDWYYMKEERCSRIVRPAFLLDVDEPISVKIHVKIENDDRLVRLRQEFYDFFLKVLQCQVFLPNRGRLRGDPPPPSLQRMPFSEGRIISGERFSKLIVGPLG